MPVHRRSPFTAAAILAVFFSYLAGSPAVAKEPEPPHEYGPPPEWKRYKELAEQAIRLRLFDPDAAKFHWTRGYKKRGYRPPLRKWIYGYATCGYVNGRNRYGAYVGDTSFVVVIDFDTVLYTELGKSDGGDMLSEACAKADLPPLPEEAPELAVPPPLGLTLMEVPDGAYVKAVAPGSGAERSGVKPGMVIVRINGIGLKGMTGAAVGAVLRGLSGPATLDLASGPSIKVLQP